MDELMPQQQQQQTPLNPLIITKFAAAASRYAAIDARFGQCSPVKKEETESDLLVGKFDVRCILQNGGRHHFILHLHVVKSNFIVFSR
jgi:hypothetical protein